MLNSEELTEKKVTETKIEFFTKRNMNKMQRYKIENILLGANSLERILGL